MYAPQLINLGRVDPSIDQQIVNNFQNLQISPGIIFSAIKKL